MSISGSLTQLRHLLSYASRFVLPLTRKAGFRLAGWPLPGGSRTLWITTKGSDHMTILLSCSPDATPIASLAFLPAAMWSTPGRAQNEAPVAILDRPGVHRVELGEACNIRLRHFDPVGENEPIYCFTAWRRRQGTLVAVIGPPGRQQAVGIDAGIDRDRRAFFRRHCRHDLVEHSIGPARSHEHADDREPAVHRRVDEMCLHGEDLAIDKVLARMMEVELRQCVAAVADVERITFRAVELDGVPVVDDRIWPLAPTGVEPRLPGADRPDEVDRGLLGPA